jgi:hypothetical protein
MLPGAVLLSSDSKAETLASMLASLKRAVEVQAGIDVWTPAGAMMDLCHALRGACLQVFPNTPVRACQFHLAQAIQRWQGAGDAQEEKPKLKRGFHHAHFQLLVSLYFSCKARASS